MKKLLLLFIVATLCAFVPARRVASAAALLIVESIAFHDSEGKWETFKSKLEFTVEIPDKPNMKRTVSIDNATQTFQFVAPYQEGVLSYEVQDNKGVAKWNGSTDIPAEFAEKYKINSDRALMYRNYYTYLYGMPMKLKDPGTIINPNVMIVDFHGKKYHQIKVNYEPEVGTDTWYFYFNLETRALEAYQFFKDDTESDGEYILFEGLVEKEGIKIPSIRKWYYNKDDKYLATDILLP